MTMQHNKFDGTLIAVGSDGRFEDRMRRIRSGYLHFATIRAGDDSPWFAVRVMSGREKAVKNNLDELNIESLLPMRKGPEYRRRGRLIPATMIPAITNYLMVRFIPKDEAFVALRGIEHVIDVLGGCSSPRYVPNEQVMKFKALADEGTLDWERPGIILKAGDKVQVTDGPFIGLHGIVVTSSDDGRGDPVVEMEIFGRMTPALLPIATLQKV